MATFYIDLENGNDASAGTSWATAWRTITNGATAARIAPGDDIRIAKTADPTSIGNGTWTNGSTTVTLATAQTANIYLDGAWTAANTGTATTTTTRKQGSNASSITTAAATAVSTKYAYLTVGGVPGLDLSTYDAITFWIQNAGVAIVANNYQIRLCSDTLGDTAVDTFDIPAIPSTGAWVPLTLTRVGGGALGNAIKSIAWYTGTVSPGNSRNVFIDNVLGCDADGLNLTSLISKSSTGFTMSETWHGLQNINGTTVSLGMRNSTGEPLSGRVGYYNPNVTSPETVTTYIRPTYKTAMLSSETTQASTINDSGTVGNLITFSGGWDTVSNTQDGCTWLDGQNGIGRGLLHDQKNYVSINRLCFTRYNTGITSLSGTSDYCSLTDIVANNTTNGISLSYRYSNIDVLVNNSGGISSINVTGSVLNIRAISGVNMPFAAGAYYENVIFWNNVDITLSNNLNFGVLDVARNSGGVAFNSTSTIEHFIVRNYDNTTITTSVVGAYVVINKLTASGNTGSNGTFSGTLIIKQTDAPSTQLIGSSAATGKPISFPALQYNAVNNNINDNRSFWEYGNALSQTTTRKTPSGVAWQINITNTNQTTDTPIYFPIARVACNANSLVTVKAWVKLSHATDIGAKLMIQRNEIAGVNADITATKSADTNWEELTITFTPTVAGVAQIYVQGYWLANLADESVFVDDITVTQA